MAKNKGPRLVQCYHCQHRFEVGGRAQNTSCPSCSRQLRLEDFVFDKKTSGIGRIKLQTCGSVTVKKGGRLTAELVEAHGGIVCHGTIEAKKVISGKTLVLGKTGLFYGHLQAPGVEMAAGAKVKPSLFEVPSDPLGLAGIDEEKAGG
ncbi:MAG: polymer-forming cytoskeletal protein [Planctomycetota bacterium]